MNYMEQVAKMLDVEMEEEFELKKGIDNLYRFKLSRIGLVYFSPSTQMWHEGNRLLVDLLLGKDEIIKIPKPILDNIEKEYLSNVIKPFRNQVKYIEKNLGTDQYDNQYEFIRFYLISVKVNSSDEILDFPYYKADTMYKGMKSGKRYSLNELGL